MFFKGDCFEKLGYYKIKTSHLFFVQIINVIFFFFNILHYYKAVFKREKRARHICSLIFQIIVLYLRFEKVHLLYKKLQGDSMVEKQLQEGDS